MSEFAELSLGDKKYQFPVITGSEAEKAIDIIQVELNEQVFNAAVSINDVFEKIKKIDYKLCKYDYHKNLLVETVYLESRDNYFLVSDLAKVNTRLNKKN